MKNFRNVLLLVLFTVLGCGQQLVEFPLNTTPTVSVTDPADTSTGVATNTRVSAAFSKAMDPSTLTDVTFTLTQAGTPVPATVTYAGTTATLVPTAALAKDTRFTATITTGAKDDVGHALGANYVWSFTTRDTPDANRPTVSLTGPLDKATGVAVGAKILAVFSEAMAPATANASTFTLTDGTVSIPGAVTYSGLTATFTPTGALTANSTFTAAITTGATDLAGNALAKSYVWGFTTSVPPDLTAPTVTFTDPAASATSVDTLATVQVAFDETMDCATLNTVTFTVTQGAVPVLGTVTCTGPTATFTPTGALALNTAFTATITAEAKDLAGNALATAYVWNFETSRLAGEARIALGAASSYAILAFNTVTNVNNVGTVVTGNLGISPGAAVVGFPPGEVIGTIHAGDPTAAAAKVALLAAYNDAVGRLGAAVLPGNLSGLTLTPGLYKNATSVLLSAGNVTLDAQGDANAVFIFQVGSTLTTGDGTQIILSGGANATSIYWAVGTSATLGTTSSFKGTLLAASAITMKTGASIEGRLLALNAAVDLDTNAITVPSP